MDRKWKNYFSLLFIFFLFWIWLFISHTYWENIREKFIWTETWNIQDLVVQSGTLISSWEVLSEFTASGNILSGILLEENIKYYSWFFQYEWNTYGNAYYDEGFEFPENILQENNIEIIEKEDFENSFINQKNISESFSLKSNFESSQMMTTMSAPNTLRDGLVWEWLLNGNALDTSGNGNHGTPYNVTWVDSGKWDGTKVASFNGVNSYIIFNTINLPSTSSARSLILNFKLTSLNFPNNEVNFLNYWYPSSNKGFWCSIRNSPEMLIRLFFWANDIDVKYPFKANIWYNIIFTYNWNTWYVYINWELKWQKSFWAVNTQLLNWTIWKLIASSTYYVPWYINFIKIYNRVLSASEIQQLYQDWFWINNNTSTNIPNYTNSPMFLNSSLVYNSTDNNALNYLSNKSQKSTSAVSKADTNNVGDPVNLATWEFDYENTLMSIPWKKLPFEFKLSYKNQTYYNWPTWINWDHNYNKYLIGETNGNQLYYNWKLWVFRFITSGTWFEYNPWLKANLVLSGWLYQINYDSWDKEYFNPLNKVSKLEDQYWNNLQFSYSWWLLSQVTDTLWRNVNYNYYEDNRLANITDFNGKKVELTYFTWASNSWSIYDLKEIKINNGTWATKMINFEYTSNGDDTTNHNITKLIDSKWQIYVTNTYLNDRVATQIYWTWTISYNYTLSGSQVTKNTVTDKVWNITDYFYDPNGNNIQTIYHATPSNVTYNYTYNSLGYMETMNLPKWNGIKYSYDTKWNLTEKRQKTDVEANNSSSDIVETFTYNARNQILTHTLPNGIVITNTYSTLGNLLSTTTSGVKKADGSTYSISQIFSYDSIWNLTYKTDGEGNGTTFTYSGGLLVSQTSGSGTEAITKTFTYDTLGRLISSTDGNGNVTTFENTDFWNLKKITSPEGISRNFEYDPNNNKTKEFITQSGSSTLEKEYFYDLLDKLTTTTTKYDTSKTRDDLATYDDNSRLVSQKSGSGAKVEFTYDAFEKVTKQTIIGDPNDASKNIVTLFVYDLNGNLIQKTDPKGNITTFTYDLFDRLTKETDTLGNYYTLTYNTDNTIAEVKKYSSWNTLLAKVKTTYNHLWQPVKEEAAKDILGNIFLSTTKVYDKNGNVVSVTDAKGNTTTFEYDTFNRLVKTTDELGNEVLQSYDKNNNTISKSIHQNNGKITTTTYVYDADNRLVSEINHQNKTKTYVYNMLWNVTQITDEQGNTTNFTYDFTGNLKTKTQLSGSGNILTSHTYDERGNMTSVTDGEGNITTHVYNNLNQLTKTKYSDNKEIIYSYDKNGNLTSQTDPNGSVITNTYDVLNRLTSRSITLGSGVWGITTETYSYDALGRLTEANDSNHHKLEFSYDDLGRLITENQSGSVVNYTYDDNNNLLSITNPNGKTTHYMYDDLNRVTSISNSGTTIATYSYTWALNDKITYGNSKEITQAFDSLNRLQSLNNGVKNYSYTYDDAGNITSDSMKNFTYDDIYRLTQVHESLSWALLENFAFDKAGNRVTDIFENTYDTNILNQYTSLSGSTNTSFIYDDNGNLINDGEKTFSYDYKNRLIKVENSSWIMVEFQYDVLGRKYEKKTSTETTTYIYSDKNILSETTTIWEISTKKEYINWLWIDNILAVEKEEGDLTLAERNELHFCNTRVLPYENEFNTYFWTWITQRCNELSQSWWTLTTNRYYFHKDHLGSIVAITNNSGTIVSEYKYDSFWNVENIYWDESLENTILYTGREYDKEINLYYYRARYYSSDLWRFISRDPIGQVDDVNIYSYVANNPVMFRDPMGTDKKIYNSTDLLNTYKSDAVEELSYWWYLPKFWYSTLAYPIKSTWTNSWNIKYNPDFQALSFDPNNNNQSCAWYWNKGAWHCLTYVDWELMELSEIWNYLIWYNWAYAWFSLNSKQMGNDIESNKLSVPYIWKPWELQHLSIITTDIYEAWMRVEFSNHYNKNNTYNENVRNALQDELIDRPLYNRWYSDASKEIRGKWGLNY